MLLLISFTSILLVTFAALALISVQIKETHSSINQIVTSNNQKSRLLVEMQQAARERSLALYSMVNIKDPFEYDDIRMKYDRYAEKFIKARETLLSMSLTKEEIELINRQGKLSRLAVPLQNIIIKFIDKERFKEAIDILINKSIPSQNAVLSQIAKIIDFQRNNNQKIVSQLEKKLDKNIIIIILISITIFILTSLTSAYVISRITKTETQLFFEKELAQTTLNSIGDGVITVDKNYLIQTINHVAEMLTDTKKQDVIGKSILSIYEGENPKQRTEINKNLESKGIQRSLFDFTLTKKDGAKFEVEHTIAPIIAKDKDVLGAVIILRDVTEVRTMEKRLSYQASHDALTGLINRREFELRLKQTIRNAQVENISHSICFLDLDKFKIINDTSGHAAGDEFLKQISKTIQSSLRQTDILARLGGDEFAIILDSCSIYQATNICNQIIKTIKDTRFSWGKNSFESGASIGIVPITKLTASVSEVMSSVDAACYEAKDKGRNRIQVFEPDNAEFIQHQAETSWIQRIKNAISENHFELYFQEIRNINPDYPTPKTIELLIRLNEDGNIVYPDSFIPTAERYNLMPMIDEWVISNTFDFINRYTDIHDNDIRVAINLSGQSLSEDSVLNLITSKLRKNKQLKKELICFEITETAAIANMSKAVEFIAEIKQMGCKFSLDDFGSGLSSFSYLKNMPIDNIKIDGIFIREINTEPTNRVFVESIHNISKIMGIKTTAEYVENEAILECIKSIGIDYAQGYHISKPAPVKNLL
ncbi:MAG: EAL domain-containing protein [Gammaproteobacteria bacterium]|nr:EAL domain-containing protein [Gammaproteobacteria bacterium]